MRPCLLDEDLFASVDRIAADTQCVPTVPELTPKSHVPKSPGKSRAHREWLDSEWHRPTLPELFLAMGGRRDEDLPVLRKKRVVLHALRRAMWQRMFAVSPRVPCVLFDLSSPELYELFRAAVPQSLVRVTSQLINTDALYKTIADALRSAGRVFRRGSRLLVDLRVLANAGIVRRDVRDIDDALAS